MTRQDIDRIASEYFNDKESEHEMDEVFDLAKKALEKQMQESKTDTWSIKDVADTLAKHGLIEEQEFILNKIRAEIIQCIQNGTLKIESGNEELFRILDEVGDTR